MVADEPAVAHEPGGGPFDDPAMGEELEALEPFLKLTGGRGTGFQPVVTEETGAGWKPARRQAGCLSHFPNRLLGGVGAFDDLDHQFRWNPRIQSTNSGTESPPST